MKNVATGLIVAGGVIVLVGALMDNGRIVSAGVALAGVGAAMIFVR